jgi:hypothetical protein
MAIGLIAFPVTACWPALNGLSVWQLAQPGIFSLTAKRLWKKSRRVWPKGEASLLTTGFGDVGLTNLLRSFSVAGQTGEQQDCGGDGSH